MVVAQIIEQNVKGDRLRAFRRQFFNESAIDLSRPVKAEVKSEVITFFDGGDAGFFHRDKREIGRNRRGKMQRSPGADVVSHAFQALEKIQTQEPEAADKREDENGQNDRRAFERFEFHRIGLNKKPEQLKAALVF